MINKEKIMEALTIIEKELYGTTKETMVPRRDTLDGSRSSELRARRPGFQVRDCNTERDSRDLGGDSE
tara:strand:- start:37 stop:240 length:204 start_codon:yes stop_codon:yes gene_type:complete